MYLVYLNGGALLCFRISILLSENRVSKEGNFSGAGIQDIQGKVC